MLIEKVSIKCLLEPSLYGCIFIVLTNENDNLYLFFFNFINFNPQFYVRFKK